MDTTQIALTAHLVVPQSPSHDALIKKAIDQLHDQFKITHTTLQVTQTKVWGGCEGSGYSSSHSSKI
jgi:cobalt-zinc-cadmium efflux system protein